MITMMRFVLFCDSDFDISISNTSNPGNYQGSFYTLQGALWKATEYKARERGGCIAFITSSGTIRPVLHVYEGSWEWAWSWFWHWWDLDEGLT